MGVVLREPAGLEIRAFTYVAGPGNPNFLGPEPLEAMASQIRRARGKSGANVDYVLRLAAALREIDGADPHVQTLADRLSG